MIYLIGGKNKESARQALIKLKKNYDPQSLCAVTPDQNLADYLGAESLFGGKSAIVMELAADWKKFDETLSKALPNVGESTVDTLIWVDGAVPKTSHLYKAVSDLGGEITIFEEVASKEVWNLLDALAGKDRASALSHLYSLLNSGESAIGLLMMITYLTRNLLSALYKNQYFESLTPFQKRELAKNSQNFTEKELTNLYSYLFFVDSALKGGTLSEELLLTTLVINYTEKRGIPLVLPAA